MLAASLDFFSKACLPGGKFVYTLPIQLKVSPLLWLKTAAPCSSKTKTGQTDTTHGCE